MSDIQPFRGLRPRLDSASRVACPPYDVLGDEQARKLAGANADSFVHVIRAEVDLEPGTDPHTERVYLQARTNLERMISSGVLVTDDQDCLYVYRLSGGGHAQHGVVLGASVDEYLAGVIKRHEHTRPVKVTDRAAHIETLGAYAGPVLLAYRDSDEISEVLRGIMAGDDPLYNFEADDGVAHTVWRVTGEGVARLQKAFGGLLAMYIADGHHRAAAAARVRDNLRQGSKATGDHFLAVAFPGSELRILGYHRLVRDLGGLETGEFLKLLADKFELNATDHGLPGAPRHFGMLLDGRWHELTVKDGSYPADDPVRSLDASILQENLLAPVLGIEDPRADPRIDFVGGNDALEELSERCREDFKLAFTLFPVGVEQLLAVADAGQVMPPKSTWFSPKLLSGLVTKTIDGRTI
jgi:uncharacterized protein (DUF1015 family)